ncbi:MAG: glucose 1-dehydrogenase [Desulfuromonadales bacterium]|nr:glucose 1-dehydrogenase [Desulfuromonadales bacterium]
MGRVDGKIAMVTGGAMGIGKATCLLLAREGAAVAVTDIDTEAGEAVAREINENGGKAIFCQQDVASEQDWQRAIGCVVSGLGGLDILVNNAGIVIVGTVESATLKEWQKTQAVNLDSVFLGTQQAIAVMKESGGGSIVNLSSIEGIIGEPNTAAYNASKGGVRIFTKSAAIHCAEQGYGIRVNSVHPGYIQTPLVENAVCSLGKDADAFVQQVIARHPVGHLGEADDIAYGILYLASDESKFVTGSELVIDGGYIAR